MAKWFFEPGHTAAEFCVRHMMVTFVRGHFKDIHGTLVFDPADPGATSVERTGMVSGFGRLIFDSSPTVIAKNASSSNEMSTNRCQDWIVVNSNSATSCTSKSRPDRVTFSANAGQFFND